MNGFDVTSWGSSRTVKGKKCVHLMDGNPKFTTSKYIAFWFERLWEGKWRISLKSGSVNQWVSVIIIKGHISLTRLKVDTLHTKSTWSEYGIPERREREWRRQFDRRPLVLRVEDEYKNYHLGYSYIRNNGSYVSSSTRPSPMEIDFNKCFSS